MNRKADVIPGGTKKPNQDAYYGKAMTGSAVPNPFAAFSICDGHGQNGHKASWLVSSYLKEANFSVMDLTGKLEMHLAAAEQALTTR